MLEILFVLIALLYGLEGFHDSRIEIVQKTGDIKPIEAWHKADTYFHIVLNIMVSFFGFVVVPTLLGFDPMWIHATVFGIMLLGFRQLFMVTTLNKIRGRKMFYIGSTANFDKIVKGFGWVIFLLAGLLIAGGYWFFKFFPV